MSDSFKDSIKGAVLQTVVGLAAFAAMWFLTVRDDLNNLRYDVGQLQEYRRNDKSRSDEQAKALQAMALEVRELRVTITLFGRGLNVPGFQ